ncbi:chromate efflux transporter [Parasedimentitalea maritima]|uniref:Chromate efflux transporter n=1 Tax=Parasedimentitalea maritima TaxID=2578117 RepID=A0A6A4RGD5_9RHOB|nr:chromate efflux transporter [Zongyanglinia marina]KAE9628612.1 chromate efflux transporter [Zongyanglinia marina]
MTSPSWRVMTRVFGRIGLLSFGGPAAQIAVMHRELVEERPWLSEQAFLRALSFCMLLPGPEAMQLATYAGWRLRGVPGGLLAGLLFVMPGALIIGILVGLYATYGTLDLVQAGFLGIKASVIVIVLLALRKLANKALHGSSAWALAGIGFVGIFALNLPFPLIVLGAGLYGLLLGNKDVVSDIEPQGLNPLSAGRQLLIWGGLWLLPLIVLSLSGASFLATIGWFFAKLAVVTFGGAYAVLAYMSQTVVEQYSWISTGQMIDALGLAETTPGPLILVTQFVAMLAGLEAQGPWMGLAAGLVVLWATFMPCFLWIFLTAPYVEQISSHPRLGAALKAITASVVGVILNLSVWFALHVLFAEVENRNYGVFSLPVPTLDSLDPIALGLIVLAALLTFATRGSMLLTLFLMALAGISTSLLPFAI